MLVLQRRLPAGNRGESPVGGPGAKRRNGAKLGLAVLTVTLGERKKGCFREAGEGKARVKVAGHVNGFAPNLIQVPVWVFEQLIIGRNSISGWHLGIEIWGSCSHVIRCSRARMAVD